MTNRLTALAAAIMLLTSTSQASADSFCARLGPKLRMNNIQQNPHAPAPAEWHVNLTTFSQFMLGGSNNASFGASPPSTCDMVKKGVECQVQGPSSLRVGTRWGKVEQEALDGEKAVVWMKGMTIHCLDKPSSAPAAAPAASTP